MTSWPTTTGSDPTGRPSHPLEAFNTRPKAFPTGYRIAPHYRVRHHRIDAAGVITIRYHSHLHHIGLSKHLRGTNVIMLIDDLNIRVLNHNTGTLIRKLVLDPPATTNPAASSAETHPKTESRCKPWLGTPVNDVPRHGISSGDRIRTCDLWVMS